MYYYFIVIIIKIEGPLLCSLPCLSLKTHVPRGPNVLVFSVTRLSGHTGHGEHPLGLGTAATQWSPGPVGVRQKALSLAKQASPRIGSHIEWSRSFRQLTLR